MMNPYDAWAQVYDHLTENVEYEARSAYISGFFLQYGVEPGAQVLDLACGTGSISRCLLERGYRVTGVDLSADMLTIAQSKCPEGAFYRASMTEYSAPAQFDACVCLLDSINHLTALSDVEDCFCRVAENLRPGGLFLFDVNTVYKHRQVLAGQTFVFDEEDYYLVWDNEALDDTAVRVLIDLFCYNGESYDRLSDSFIERAYTHRQLTAALSEFEILGRYAELTKPAAGMIEQPSYIAAGGTEHGYTNFSSGLGFLLTYDTRDVPANAYRGTYLDFRGMMYSKVFGGDDNFYRLEIDYRQYKTVGRRKVVAWTVQTKNVFGDVPLTKYTLSGTPFDLRGYYMGQFRDKSSHVIMAEYRQMINTDKSTWVKRMLNHVGYVAWGGCGFMGPTPGKIEGVLPNLGLGLRIEVQPRMNVRLDYGRDMVNKQNLFYFNMTEAF